MAKFTVLILSEASEYMQRMSEADQGITKADIECMESGAFEVVKTKQLRGKVRELIVGSHRFTYFQKSGTIYFIRGFQKKSTKTPKREIDYAEQILHAIKNSHQ